MPWPTPNVLGSQFDAKFGRWGGPQNWLYSPTQLPNLSAWFDALDTQTMLAGDGNIVTDGGTVCLWKDKSGNSSVNALVLPGVAANYASTPDAAALDITGDIDLRAFVALADWTPAAQQAIIGKMQSAAVRSYRMDIGTGSDAGKILLNWSADGSTQLTEKSTVAVSASDYASIWIRATLDVDDGAGNRVSKFYTSADGSTWTQLGDTVTTAGTTSIFNTASVVEVGAAFVGSVLPTTGRIYRVQLYASTDSTDQRLDIDFTAAPTKLANDDTFVCTTGQTVTLKSSGATGARIAGERDWYQGTAASRGAYNAAGKYIATDGSDDYYKTAAFPLPQPVTLYAVIYQTTWTSGDYLIDGSASDTLALIQTTSTPQINLSAGSSVAANTDLAVETKALVTIVSNGASSLVSINRLAPTTGNAGAGVPNGLTLASKGTAGSYGNARYHEIAVYRAAHDQATRHRFALYAGRRWGFTV